MSRLFVLLTGPIGAGKTTLAPLVLDWFHGELEYISTDLYYWIKYGADFTNIDARYGVVKELARQRLEVAIQSGIPILWETVVASTWKLELLARAKTEGYQILTVFLLGGGPVQCERRSDQRSQIGWYAVSPQKVAQRYSDVGRVKDKLHSISNRWIELETEMGRFNLVQDSLVCDH